jgi:Sulfotransferase family
MRRTLRGALREFDVSATRASRADDLRHRENLVNTIKAPLRRLRPHYRTLTGPLRGLPSVLIIGTAKGGTTSLFNYLAHHPDVVPPLGKEMHYFDMYYARGERWYRGRFPYEYRLRNGTLTLDASPYYLFHPLAPERAARLLPDAKLIALLRNPVDRPVALSLRSRPRMGDAVVRRSDRA